VYVCVCVHSRSDNGGSLETCPRTVPRGQADVIRCNNHNLLAPQGTVSNHLLGLAGAGCWLTSKNLAPQRTQNDESVQGCQRTAWGRFPRNSLLSAWGRRGRWPFVMRSETFTAVETPSLALAKDTQSSRILLTLKCFLFLRTTPYAQTAQTAQTGRIESGPPVKPGKVPFFARWPSRPLQGCTLLQNHSRSRPPPHYHWRSPRRHHHSTQSVSQGSQAPHFNSNLVLEQRLASTTQHIPATMALQSTADVPLLITSPNSSSERRISPSWSIAQLKGRLEPITGVPASCQQLSLRVGSQDAVAITAADEEQTRLAAFPLQPYAEMTVSASSTLSLHSVGCPVLDRFDILPSRQLPHFLFPPRLSHPSTP